MRPDGFSYDRRIKNDRRLSYSVQDGLLGLDVEQVDLVGIEGMVKELYAGSGAVRKTLHKYTLAR